MAEVVYNVHKNRVYQSYLTGKTFGILLLSATDSDAEDPDLDTVADLLGVSGVTECAFTNYERKTLSGVTSTEDDTNNRANVDAADVTWTAAGGAVNETPVAAVIYEEGANDSQRYLVSYHTTGLGSTSTNGGDFTVNIADFLRAS